MSFRSLLTFLILILPFHNAICSDSLKKLFKQKVRQKLYKKTPAPMKEILASKGPSTKSVLVKELRKDSRVLARNFYLPMAKNRFYFKRKHIKTYFGVEPDLMGALNWKRGGFHFDASTFFKDSLNRKLVDLLGIGQEKLYQVRTVSTLLNLDVSWNSKSKILSFKKPKPGKGPLDKKWKDVLRKSGSLDYLEKIEKILRGGKREVPGPKVPDPKPKEKQDPVVPKTPGFPDNPKNLQFQRIYATSFEAQTIASAGKRGDWYMRDTDLGVALPSRSALGKRVILYYPKTGKYLVAPVIDVGPWNIKDPYWVRDRRPAAETGVDERGRRTNMAGIDLSYETWARLGIGRKKAFKGVHSDYLHWDFVDES